MAVRRKVNYLSQQRVDVPMMRSVESAVINDFSEAFEGLVIGYGKSYVLRGFEINFDAAIGSNANALKLIVAGGAILHGSSDVGGTMYVVSQTEEEQVLSTASNDKVVGGFTPGVKNYVGLELERDPADSTTGQVYIWNPTTEAETSKTAPLAELLTYKLVITSTIWAPNILPLCTVTTDLNNNVDGVGGIEDRRPLLFRLGTAGISTPDKFYEYPWTDHEDDAEFRKENHWLSTSTISPFRGGDKMLSNLKEWMDAVMSCIWEIKGTTYWYSPIDDQGGSIVKLRTDACNTILTGKGTVTHSPTTPGLLNWDDDIYISVISNKIKYKLAANNTSTNVQLNDGQVAYLKLKRDADIAPYLTFTNGSPIVTSIGNAVWTSTLGLQAGDYIKDANETDAFYYEILSVDSDTQVTLTENFNEATSPGSGVQAYYTYGSYEPNATPSLDRHLFIDNKEDVELNQDNFWLFYRDDNPALDGAGTPELQELTSIQVAADVDGSLKGKYFTIANQADNTEYYVWFDTDGTTDDPNLDGRTGIKVDITGDNPEKTEVQVVGDVGGNLSATSFTLWSGDAVNLDYHVWLNLGDGAIDPGGSANPIEVSIVGDVAESTTIQTTQDVQGSLDGSYFLLDSADGNQYYVWYNTNGTSTDPGIVGRTGLEINILGELQEISTIETVAATPALSNQFIAFASSLDATLYHVWFNTGIAPTDPGVTPNSIEVALNVDTPEISTIQTTDDANSQLDGTYFTLYSANDDTQYYVWFNNKNTSPTISTDPNPTGYDQGIQVDFEGDVKETFTVQTRADDSYGAGGTLDATYFTMSSATDATDYYVWYSINGNTVDPAIAGATGIRVDIIGDQRQESTIQTIDDVAGSLNSTWFRLPAQDGTNYYVWLSNGTGVDPATIPANNLGGWSSIPVIFTDNDNAATIATLIGTAIGTVAAADFTTTGPVGNLLTVTDQNEGAANILLDGNNPTTFIFTNTQLGSVAESAASVASKTAIAVNANADFNALLETSDTVRIETSAFGGPTTDTADGAVPTNFTFTKIYDGTSTITAAALATLTANAINAIADFGAVALADVVTITNANPGDSTDTFDNSTGFTINTTVNGATADTATEVATKIVTAINANTGADFTAVSVGDTITLTTTGYGAVANNIATSTAFTVNVTQEGSSSDTDVVIATLTEAAITGTGSYTTAIAGNLITITDNTFGDTSDIIDSPAPADTGFTFTRLVNGTTAESANNVAVKIANAINAQPDFDAYAINDVVTIINTDNGISTDITDVDTNFTFTKIVDGTDADAAQIVRDALRDALNLVGDFIATDGAAVDIVDVKNATGGAAQDATDGQDATGFTFTNTTQGFSATVFARFLSAELEQGEQRFISDNKNIAFQDYMGAINEVDSTPDYNASIDFGVYNKPVHRSASYETTNNESLTVRCAKLTALMADKSQDKTIKYALYGNNHFENIVDAVTNFSTITANDPTGTLTAIIPSTEGNLEITLSGSLVIGRGQAAYYTIDRNADKAITMDSLTVVNTENVPLEDNTFIFAYKLNNDSVYLWDDTRITEFRNALGEPTKAQATLTMPTGGQATTGTYFKFLALDNDTLMQKCYFVWFDQNNEATGSGEAQVTAQSFLTGGIDAVSASLSANGITYTSNISGEVGNNISLSIVDSTQESISIEGYNIVIYANITGGKLNSDIVTDISNDGAASALISANAGTSGANVATALVQSSLAGGTEEIKSELIAGGMRYVAKAIGALGNVLEVAVVNGATEEINVDGGGTIITATIIAGTTNKATLANLINTHTEASALIEAIDFIDPRSMNTDIENCIGFQIPTDAGDAAADIAERVSNALQSIQSISASNNGNDVIITQNNYGEVSDPSNGINQGTIPGFSVVINEVGVSEENHYIDDGDTMELTAKKLDIALFRREQDIEALEDVINTNVYEETVTIINTTPTSDHEYQTNVPATAFAHESVIANSFISLPLDGRDNDRQEIYVVNSGTLEVYLNGQKLHKDIDYREVGLDGYPSTQIQILSNFYLDDVIKFRIDSTGGWQVPFTGGTSSLQDAYDLGNTIQINSNNGDPYIIFSGSSNDKTLEIQGYLDVLNFLRIGDGFEFLIRNASNPLDNNQDGMYVNEDGDLIQQVSGTPDELINITRRLRNINEVLGIDLDNYTGDINYLYYPDTANHAAFLPFTDDDDIITALSTNTENINTLGDILNEPVYEETVTIVDTVATPIYELLPNASSSHTISLPPDSGTGDTKVYSPGTKVLEVYLNGQLLHKGIDYNEGTADPTSIITMLRPTILDDVILFRIDTTGGFIYGGDTAPNTTSLQDAYDVGNNINTDAGGPVNIMRTVAGKALSVQGDLEVTGVIDPIGLQFSTPPGTVNPLTATQHGIWLDEATGYLYQERPGFAQATVNLTLDALGQGASARIITNVLNNSGATINALNIVSIDTAGYMKETNVSSNGREVDAERDALTAIGLITTTTAFGAVGEVVTIGTYENYTTAADWGSIMYVNKGGGLTNIKPSIGDTNGFEAGDWVVKAGIIVRNSTDTGGSGTDKDLLIDVRVVGQL